MVPAALEGLHTAFIARPLIAAHRLVKRHSESSLTSLIVSASTGLLPACMICVLRWFIDYSFAVSFALYGLDSTVVQWMEMACQLHQLS